MQLVVSFCNLRVPSLPSLGLIDTTTLGFSALRLPEELPRIKGITGLAFDERYFYAGIQALGLPEGEGFGGVSSLLVLDRRDFSLVSHQAFRTVVEVHSLCLIGHVLYCVSTGTDEVVAVKLRDGCVAGESVFWRPDPSGPREDLHHLNSYAYPVDSRYLCRNIRGWAGRTFRRL